MATILDDYGKLSALVEKLGITWKIDSDSDPKLAEATIILATKPSEAHQQVVISNPLDMRNTVDVLTFLFQIGLLADTASDLETKAMDEYNKILKSDNPDSRRRFITLYQRAGALGCSIVCGEVRSHHLKGRRCMGTFNCIYQRPYQIHCDFCTAVDSKVENAYDRRVPHVRDGQDQKFLWYFDLPRDFDLLEAFVTHDKQLCQKSS